MGYDTAAIWSTDFARFEQAAFLSVCNEYSVCVCVLDAIFIQICIPVLSFLIHKVLIMNFLYCISLVLYFKAQAVMGSLQWPKLMAMVSVATGVHNCHHSVPVQIRIQLHRSSRVLSHGSDMVVVF